MPVVSKQSLLQLVLRIGLEAFYGLVSNFAREFKRKSLPATSHSLLTWPFFPLFKELRDTLKPENLEEIPYPKCIFSQEIAAEGRTSMRADRNYRYDISFAPDFGLAPNVMAAVEIGDALLS